MCTYAYSIMIIIIAGFSSVVVSLLVQLRLYVCMCSLYVCMYVCMHVCVYACMYVCVYACMCVCMNARMYVYRYNDNYHSWLLYILSMKNYR